MSDAHLYPKGPIRDAITALAGLRGPYTGDRLAALVGIVSALRQEVSRLPVQWPGRADEYRAARGLVLSQCDLICRRLEGTNYQANINAIVAAMATVQTIQNEFPFRAAA